MRSTKCQSCGSKRIMQLSAKCSDMCYFKYMGKEHDGYVPDGCNIDQGNDSDYLSPDICLNCGQTQGEWPVYPEFNYDSI